MEAASQRTAPPKKTHKTTHARTSGGRPQRGVGSGAAREGAPWQHLQRRKGPRHCTKGGCAERYTHAVIHEQTHSQSPHHHPRDHTPSPGRASRVQANDVACITFSKLFWREHIAFYIHTARAHSARYRRGRVCVYTPGVRVCSWDARAAARAANRRAQAGAQLKQGGMAGARLPAQRVRRVRRWAFVLRRSAAT